MKAVASCHMQAQESTRLKKGRFRGQELNDQKRRKEEPEPAPFVTNIPIDSSSAIVGKEGAGVGLIYYEHPISASRQPSSKVAERCQLNETR